MKIIKVLYVVPQKWYITDINVISTNEHEYSGWKLTIHSLHNCEKNICLN